jgi:multidrug resistance efflux pump
MKFTTIIAIALVFLTSACMQNENESDAYGNFEANDYMISAENAGKILSLDIDEGDVFVKAEQVGLIDTTQLFLQKEQLKAEKRSIASGVQNILSRIAVYQEQLTILKKDKSRIDKMFTDGAATSKQVDDINGNILVVQKQIQAVKTENAKVLGSLENVTRKVDALNDLIEKSKIYVPEAATVLEKHFFKLITD